MFLNPTLASGIPRVVKNIVLHANDSLPDVECIPVFYKHNSAYRVKKPVPGPIELLFAKAQGGFHTLFEFFEARYNALLGASVTTRFRFFNSLKILVVKAIIFLIRAARYLSKRLRTFIAGTVRGDRIDILEDDVLVMLDASWQKDTQIRVNIAKTCGTKVVCVIHDLIPVTHPGLFDEKLVRNYNQWLDWIIGAADGYMAVSKSTRDLAKTLIKAKLSSEEFERRWFDYFYLGSELNIAPNTVVRDEVRLIFDGSLPVYLMVSTIEPRKNHAYLLDAFTDLWNNGRNLTLCFVGRIGWKCEDLLKQIYSHPELNRRLFMLNDLNDTELEYAYHHSRSLVFSSIAEGFGLPIVEAMQRGLPAMVSDIPVFREIGGEYCTYFNLDDHRSLCGLVMQFEATGVFPAIKSLTGYDWLTWRQATERFLKKIIGHLADQANA